MPTFSKVTTECDICSGNERPMVERVTDTTEGPRESLGGGSLLSSLYGQISDKRGKLHLEP